MHSFIYRFGVFELNPATFELRRNSHIVKIERIPMELLILLLESESRVVSRHEIVNRLWGESVFVDTEAGINTAVRKIRQAIRDNPDNPKFLQTVTGKGYRFVGASTEAVELAPARPAAVTEQPPSSPVHPATKVVLSRNSSWGVLGVFLVLLVGVGSWYVHGKTTQSDPIRSVAVLPLLNLTGDGEQEYLADGMTDELTTMLAKDSNLRVTSRTSAMQYKNSHRAIPDIAHELHVDGIIEGSISRSKDSIHMTVQLIRGDTDSHFWADSYDRDGHDTQLAAEAADAIAKRLNSRKVANTAARVISQAAHDAFLRGRYLWHTDRMSESGAYFQKATELQPDYAEAWAWLSCFYGKGVAGDLLDPQTNLELEWQAAKRALEIDPDLPDAHWAMGAAYLIARWDWANADREMQEAIRIDSQNAEYYYVRGCVLEAMGRFDEGIANGKKAVEIDPFGEPYVLAYMYLNARQYDAAAREFQLRTAGAASSADLLENMADVWRRKGNYKEATLTSIKSLNVMGDRLAAARLQSAYEAGGVKGAQRWELRRKLQQSKAQYISLAEIAMRYAELRDKDKTLQLLEQACHQRSTDCLWIQMDPQFDFLHEDTRYRALVKYVGEPPLY